MMKTLMFALSLMAWLPTQPAGAQSQPKVTWSPNLNLRSIDEIPKRLREPQGTTLAMKKGDASFKVANCEEFLNAVSAGLYTATNYDNKMSSRFVHDCFVLRDLQHARAPTTSGSYRITENTLAQLPPMLVTGSREVTDVAEQAEKRGESWKQFKPALRLTRIDVDSLDAEDDDTDYFLTIRGERRFYR
jgi:hypothetical protein